jgi:acid phosphatase type 7
MVRRRTAPFLVSLMLATGLLPAAPSERVLMSFDQAWRVFDTGAAAPGGWETSDFEDAHWASAPGIVAHMREPESLRVGKPAHALRPGGDTVYLRTRFALDRAPEAGAQLLLDFVAKDGAVFYLNGVEIGRTPTIAAGAVDHGTRATRSPRLRLKTGFFIDPALLRAGTNTFAASLHSHIDEENHDERALAVELTLVEGYADRAATTTPRHLRVLWVENPQHEAMVSWTTDAAATDHRLLYDREPRRGRPEAYAHGAAPARAGAFSLSRADVRQGTRPGHFVHVHLRDLEPDTTYHFTAVSDGERSAEFHFRTAPAEDRPIKLLFGGDSRVGGNEPYFHHDRRSMNRRMAALAEEHPDILALVHGGDFVQLTQWRFLEPWLTDHELTRTQDGRILPLVPVRGNHDRDIGFEETFWWPGQEGRYYFETAFTPRHRLVVLNSEISLGGTQRAWLAETLARARAESRWLLAAYHKPAWPSVRGFADAAPRRRFWVPLFEQHRIDLALESHDHALKRTVPILAEAEHPEGIVYIGDGGLGVPQRNPDPSRWYLRGDALARAAHHVHILDFTETELHGTAYGLGGEVLDAFTRPLRPEQAWTGDTEANTLLTAGATE